MGQHSIIKMHLTAPLQLTPTEKHQVVFLTMLNYQIISVCQH